MKIKKTYIALSLLISLLASSHLFAQPTPAPLPDDSLSFCRKQTYAKACLNVLLTYRCSQYYSVFTPVKQNLCSASANSMIDFLDYKTVKVINDNKIYRFKIIFTNKLISLINDSNVQKYLSSLASDLKEAMLFRKEFDLYEYTFKHAKNRDLTILWLGVLFQDTTFSRVQVQFLEDLNQAGKLSTAELRMKNLMKEIAIMLNPKNLLKEDYKSWLKLYPKIEGVEFDSFLNPTFYHFYPIALMASHLRTKYFFKKYAHLLPFALNSDYEFQSLDPDNWPWRHPKPFKLTGKFEWKLVDIYTGLMASLFGSKKEELLPEYNNFKSQFAKSPFKAMKKWAF